MLIVGKTVKSVAPAGVILLVWENPWPGYGGSDLRNQFLIAEISREFLIDLVIYSRELLSDDQLSRSQQYCRNVTVVQNRTNTLREQFLVGARALTGRMPFHTAMVDRSFGKYSIGDQSGVSEHIVYCSQSHWGSIANRCQSSALWILDQHNADLEFWRIYASEAQDWKSRFLRRINFRLAASHLPDLYRKVGCVVSTCKEDKALTRSLSPSARVEVVENPVDCSYFAPHRSRKNRRPRILFTGTYNDRNLCALRRFMVSTLPQVRQQIPGLEFIVGGNFNAASQAELKKLGEVTFTGIIPDLRPTYDGCDAFVNPFWNSSYGSKLKVAQALSMGMCIVTSPEGARGFPVTDDETALVAENEDEFVSKLVKALIHDDLRTRIGTAARQLALQKLDWPIVGRRLREVIRSVYADRNCRAKKEGKLLGESVAETQRSDWIRR